MTTMLDSALSYAQRGWAVFPIAPGQKKPPLTPHGCLDATTDLAVVRKWWTDNPNANIGCEPERSHLVFGDIDVKDGAPGLESWRELKAKCGQFIEETICQETPSGGQHCIWRDNGVAVPNEAEHGSHLGEGIGIRARGYYILLTPSVLADGTSYHWALGYGPEEREPSVFPDCLAQLLKPRLRPEVQPIVVVTPANGVLGGDYWLQKAREKATLGSRHYSGLWLAQQLRAAQLPQDEAAAYMLDFAEHCEKLGPCDEPADIHMSETLRQVYNWANFDKQPATMPPPESPPPWMEMELEQTPEGFDWDNLTMTLPDINLVVKNLPTPDNTIPGPQSPGYAAPARITEWTAESLLNTEFPDQKWTVPDLLPEGLAILAGRPKLGKSFLALQLAIAVATGGRFLGHEIAQGGVLYIALEDGPRRLQRRLTKMAAPHSTRLVFRLTWPLLGAGGVKALDTYIAKVQPALIVIDTLGKLSGKTDSNDYSEVGVLLGPLQSLAIQSGVCILCVDHHKKPGPESHDVVDDVLGSTAKAGAADVIWGLYRKRGGGNATLNVTGRDLESCELSLQFDRSTACWQATADEHGVKEGTVQSVVLDALQALGGTASLTELEVYLGRPKSNISRELAELTAKGAVVRDGNYHGAPYKVA